MLAIIAGKGELAKSICQSLCEKPLICTLDGNNPDGIKPEIIFRLETLGSFLDTLKLRGVTELCFCGAVVRPKIDITKIDHATLPLIPVLQRALLPGDDGALRALLSVFEQENITIRGAHEIVRDLLPPSGVLTQTQPRKDLTLDLDSAREAQRRMSGIDEGQACVVRGSDIIVCEDSRGTDKMLYELVSTNNSSAESRSSDLFFGVMDEINDALGTAADWLTGSDLHRLPPKRQAGILFKFPKLGQDRRVDLPTIGPRTIQYAAQAGIEGIVLEAQGVIVINRSSVITLCDQSNLFLLVRSMHSCECSL